MCEDVGGFRGVGVCEVAEGGEEGWGRNEETPLLSSVWLYKLGGNGNYMDEIRNY